MIVLGISGVLGHDPAACLLRDGELIAFAEEERFTRQKYAPNSFPMNATAYCLAAAGLPPEAVDVVAASWDPSLDPSSGYFGTWLPRFLQYRLWNGHRPEAFYVPHHLAHAVAPAYFQGVDEAAVLVVDGNGERAATTIARLDQQGFHVLEEYPITQSLGHFYMWAAAYLGLGAHGEGRLMGLAGHGRARDDISAITVGAEGYAIGFDAPADLPSTDRLVRLAKLWRSWFEERFGPPEPATPAWDPATWQVRSNAPSVLDRADVAAAVQHKLVAAVVQLARRATKLSGHQRLILAGGVALNGGANAAILDDGAAAELVFFPACGDAGAALGAAAWVARDRGDSWVTPVAGPYLGPAATPDAVSHLLARSGLHFTPVSDPATEAARLISRGCIVAWCRGAMEAGPRALGNRSILARANDSAIATRVNQIKGREAWRPLGPSLIEEAAARFFTRATPSPYMLEFRTVREQSRCGLAAVVHADGTTRPQIVTGAANPEYHRLISAVGELTGVPAVLNTSFNVGSEPIVCSPLDAIRTYVTSDLDALFLENYMLAKPEYGK